LRQKPAPSGTVIDPWTSGRLSLLEGRRQPLTDDGGVSGGTVRILIIQNYTT